MYIGSSGMYVATVRRINTMADIAHNLHIFAESARARGLNVADVESGFKV